jgi:hypothetical protein
VVTEQKVRRCSCDIPRPWTDPRRSGFCVACLGKLPPPLPVEVERLFEALAETLEGSGLKPRVGPAPEYEAFHAHTMFRVQEGERLYRDRWRRQDMVKEALDELPDACVYSFAQMVKDGERNADLFEAVVHAYKSYVAFRRYQARQRGSA